MLESASASGPPVALFLFGVKVRLPTPGEATPPPRPDAGLPEAATPLGWNVLAAATQSRTATCNVILKRRAARGARRGLSKVCMTENSPWVIGAHGCAPRVLKL